MHSVPFRLNFAIESFIKTLAIETRIFSQLSKPFMLHNMTQRYDKDCRPLRIQTAHVVLELTYESDLVEP